MGERPPEREPSAVDPNASPWPVPPIEGIPFDADSDEAKAIERILDRAQNDEEKAPAR